MGKMQWCVRYDRWEYGSARCRMKGVVVGEEGRGREEGGREGGREGRGREEGGKREGRGREEGGKREGRGTYQADER
jgi:hypothetical protein